MSVNLGQGVNTLNLAAGVNSLAGAFNFQSIIGTASSDTLTLAQVGNLGATRVDLGAGNDTLNLGPGSFGVTFVYADSDGDDVVSGFNPGNGDKIDLTGVSGVHSLADVQHIASSPNGTDTIITFAPGNTLTLTGILPAGLVDNDFLFAGTDIVSGTITGSVVEAGGVSNATPGTPTATGALTDNASNVFTVAAAGTPSTGGFGTYQMTAAGTWTYTLDNSNSTVQALQAGAHLADTFTVTAAEGTQQLISIDITGANDAAVISGTASGSVTEAGGVNNTTPGTVTASATLTDTDVDNPANTFTAVAAGAATTNGYGTFQMTAGGTWTYTLNDNNATVQALNALSAPLTDTFTVTTIDGTAQLVTVTIHGANDAAVISGTASGSVTEAGGVNNGAPGTATASGTLTDTDVDNPANTFTPVAAGAATTNGYGTFQMTAAGTWTYTLDNNNAAVEALNASSALLTDSFTVTTVDGTAQLVTVTIHGANDTPVITAASLTVSEGGTVLFTPASIGITDPDSSSFTFTVTNLSHGTFQTTTDGTNWVNATTFTTADLTASHVRFVQDGSATAPTFSIQANDGAALNNFSNVFTGSVSFTIVNNAPLITAASLAVSEGGMVLFTPASIGITDPDNSSFTFTVTNVSHGSFQTTVDGVHWVNATAFTTADLTASHVRFVHDDGLLAPTFSIQADDGAAVNNLSNVFAGNVTFTPVANAIPGDNNNNTLTGTPGNDVLQAFGGDDSINGLGGFDRALYTDATGGITANLAAGTVSGAGVGNDTLTAIEGIVGSDFADTFNAAGFTGSSGVPGTPIGFNEFEGRGGNDTITGAVNGFGAALTRVSYVSATAGVIVDIAAGTADGDASVGHDTFVGPGILAVWGSAFADTLLGSNNGFGTVEVFAGFGGNDVINGRGGFDRADYNNDPATTSGITVHLAAGTVTGDATVGTDTLISVEAVRGTNFADTYDATGFSGTSANAGSLGTFNEVTGEGGDDTIIGNGNTRISFTNATAGVTVDIAAGTASGDASVGTDHFTGVNAVMGSMFADTLSGSAGNETFTGLGGNDVIDGRGGFDTVSYNNIYISTGGVSVDLAAGTATGDSSIGTDTLRSIEAIQGTNAADTFVATGYGLPGALNVGNNGTFNQFEGLGGDDTITGNGNTRIIYTNAGAGGVRSILRPVPRAATRRSVMIPSSASTLLPAVIPTIPISLPDLQGHSGAGSFGPFNAFLGNGGNDTITGNGNTQLQYNNATAGVTIHMNAGTADGDASVGHDTFTGVFSVIGGNFADVYDAVGFAGLSAFNDFQGLAGNDTITGNGNTQLDYNNATASVTVDLQAGTAVGDASVGSDTFTGVNAIQGSNFADIISGNAGANSLFGNGGNDILDGRGGGDFLVGGAGADTFVYAKGYGAVTISDFDQGDGIFNQAEADQLQLSGFTGQPTITNVGGNTIEDFGNGDVLTLLNVNLQPSITGDLSVLTVKGSGVQLTGLATATTTADLQAVDPGFTPDQLTFTVTATSHGHLATTATGPAITSFTQTQLNNGLVFFVADSLNADGTPYVGQGSFTVSLSNGVVATPPTTVGVTIVDAQLSVLTRGRLQLRPGQFDRGDGIRHDRSRCTASGHDVHDRQCGGQS